MSLQNQKETLKLNWVRTSVPLLIGQSMHLVCNMKKGKTKAMLFGTQKRIKDQSLDIQHCFNTLSFTSCYKYLGEKLVDQTLELHKYVDSVYIKASGRLYLLKCVRQ